jgi:hypothetical protein
VQNTQQQLQPVLSLFTTTCTMYDYVMASSHDPISNPQLPFVA